MPEQIKTIEIQNSNEVDDSLYVLRSDFEAMKVFGLALEQNVVTAETRRDFFKKIIDKVEEQNN